MIVEASTDVVHDQVFALAERTLGGGRSNECYSEHKDAYVHLFVGGYPADGFDEAYARGIAADLSTLIAPLGWFVAKLHFDHHEAEDADEFPDEEPQLMCFIDVFPMEGARVALLWHPSAPHAWHASPRAARDGILADGLRPSTGGSDFIVTANARIYVVVDRQDVEHVVADMRRWRTDWDEWDLWRIDLAAVPDHVWRDDVEARGMCAWTDAAIPATAVSLVPEAER
jgi:hypothetical protein